MPSHAVLTEEDLRQMENGGGLKEATEKDRDTIYNNFNDWIGDQGYTDITQLDCAKIEDLVSKYFFTMRITPKGKSKGDGKERRPMGNSARKYYSQLKMSLLTRFKIDFDDKAKFPNLAKKMKAFFDTIAEEGLAKTNSHEEIPADSLDEIYKLIFHVYEALKHRDDQDIFMQHLGHIPGEYHRKLNYLAQYGAQLTLLMLDIRRGNENLHKLKVSNFVKEHDRERDIFYWKKIISEKDKNHTGTEDYRNSGIIPFFNVNQYFNPGQILEEYIEYLPDADKQDTLLFTQPRQASKKFDIFDPDTKILFNAKTPVGINTIYAMLPNLCDAAQVDRCTNHQVRPTVIKNLRRSGFPATEIMKLSGHRSADSIAKNYDHTLDAKQKVDMAAAICFAPQLQRGDINSVKVYENIPKKSDRARSKVNYYNSNSDLTAVDGDRPRFEIDSDAIEIVDDEFEEDSLFSEENIFQLPDSDDELLGKVDLNELEEEQSKMVEADMLQNSTVPQNVSAPQKFQSVSPTFPQNNAAPQNFAYPQNAAANNSFAVPLNMQSSAHTAVGQNSSQVGNPGFNAMSLGMFNQAFNPQMMNFMQNPFFPGFNNFGFNPMMMSAYASAMQNASISNMNPGMMMSSPMMNQMQMNPMMQGFQNQIETATSTSNASLHSPASNVPVAQLPDLAATNNGLKELQEYLDNGNKEKPKRHASNLPEKSSAGNESKRVDGNLGARTIAIKKPVTSTVTSGSSKKIAMKRPVTSTITSGSAKVQDGANSVRGRSSFSVFKSPASSNRLSAKDEDDEDFAPTQSLMGGLSGKTVPPVKEQSWMQNRKRRADYSVSGRTANKDNIQLSMTQSTSKLVKAGGKSTITSLTSKQDILMTTKECQSLQRITKTSRTRQEIGDRSSNDAPSFQRTMTTYGGSSTAKTTVKSSILPAPKGSGTTSTIKSRRSSRVTVAEESSNTIKKSGKSGTSATGLSTISTRKATKALTNTTPNKGSVSKETRAKRSKEAWLIKES